MYMNNVEIVGQGSVDVERGEDPENQIYRSAEKAQKGYSAAMAKRELERLKESGEATPEEIEAQEAYLQERLQVYEDIGDKPEKKAVNWLLLAALGAGAFFLLKG